MNYYHVACSFFIFLAERSFFTNYTYFVMPVEIYIYIKRCELFNLFFFSATIIMHIHSFIYISILSEKRNLYSSGSDFLINGRHLACIICNWHRWDIIWQIDELYMIAPGPALADRSGYYWLSNGHGHWVALYMTWIFLLYKDIWINNPCRCIYCKKTWFALVKSSNTYLTVIEGN